MNAPPRPLQRTVLLLEGLFCTACAALIERALLREHGVEEAAVNFAADAAVVAWRGDDDTPERLCRRVKQLGYGARLTGDGSDAPSRDRQLRDLQLRLGVGLFFAMWTMLPSVGLYLDVSEDPRVMTGLAWAAGLFSLPVVLWCGLPFYRMGLQTLRAGLGGVDAMITLGVAASLALSAAELLRGGWDVYFEVPVALIVAQLLARLLDLRVRRSAQGAVLALLELVPTRVKRRRGDGTTETVGLAEIAAGDRVLVDAGDTAPVDGRIESGRSYVDRSLFSGEAAAVLREAGDDLCAGEQVLDGALVLRVTVAPNERRLDTLSRLIGRFLAGRPPWQRFLDDVAGWFLWAAAAAAALAAALACLDGLPAAQAAERALATFVVACPCALSLAAPLPGLFASAAASRAGLILRDLTALTRAARPGVLFLDKTGTLTEGRPAVSGVHVVAAAETADTVVAAAAWAETGAGHPLARAVIAAARDLPPAPDDGAAPLQVVPGAGVVRGELRVGSRRWLETLGLTVPPLPAGPQTRVWVARGSEVIGALDIDDALRPTVPAALERLRARGMRIALLSGDGAGPVQALAVRLRIEGHAAQSPEDKVAAIRRVQAQGTVVAFVGDGLNDGPALAAADLGIAVSGAADTARAAAAVNVLQGGVDRLPELFALTDRARAVINGNLFWALGYNVLAVAAAVSGFVHPAAAALAMTASSLTMVLNSLRAGSSPRPGPAPARQGSALATEQ